MAYIKISVIIPVYNASQFVTQAVESALAQPETAEVILVEDGSPDGSLAVCQALAEKHAKVHLLRHPNGENRGAGASRNMGMKNAQYDYIAFLDADDYYLPGRFSRAKEIFEADPACDGVYDAIGTFIQDEEADLRWRESKEMQNEIITIKKVIPPEALLEKLVLGGAGYFHADGLLLQKKILNKSGLMNEQLRLHQDNDFFFRLAAVGKLLPGRLDEPVAIRRVHQQNRITAPRSQNQKIRDRMKMFKATYAWFRNNSNKAKREVVFRGITKFWMRQVKPEKKIILFEIKKRVHLFALLLVFPSVIFDSYFWFRFLPVRLRQKIQ